MNTTEELPIQDQKLAAFLVENDYYNIRFLKDGIVCNSHFLYTDAVIINPNWTGYERRICYPKQSGLAEIMCVTMQSVDDEPLAGYTALK
ncbi:MAG: hypothetical protein WC100_01710 [Sterolibacterium sp.]